MDNFLPNFRMGVVTYLCLDLSQPMLVKGPRIHSAWQSLLGNRWTINGSSSRQSCDMDSSSKMTSHISEAESNSVFSVPAPWRVNGNLSLDSFVHQGVVVVVVVEPCCHGNFLMTKRIALDIWPCTKTNDSIGDGPFWNGWPSYKYRIFSAHWIIKPIWQNSRWPSCWGNCKQRHTDIRWDEAIQFQCTCN